MSITDLKLRAQKLEQHILTAKQHRRDTIAKILALEGELEAGISKQHRLTQDDKELHLSTAQLICHYQKWVKYYTERITHDTEKLRKLHAEPKQDGEKPKVLLPIILISAVLLLGLFAIVKPQLTGLVVKDGSKLYTDTVTKTFTDSGTWQFTPEQQKTGMKLSELRLTGTVEGTGTARMLLNGNVVIDYTLNAPKTEPAPMPTEPAMAPPETTIPAADTGANASATAAPSQDTPVDTTAVSTADQPTTDVQVGLGDLTGNVVLEKSSKKFTLDCVESCTLDIPRADTYALTVEINGIKLTVDTASYKLTEDNATQSATGVIAPAPTSTTPAAPTSTVPTPPATPVSVPVTNTTDQSQIATTLSNVTSDATATLSSTPTVPGEVNFMISVKDKDKNDLDSDISIGEGLSEDVYNVTYHADKRKHDGKLKTGNYHAMIKLNGKAVKQIELFNLSIAQDMTSLVDVDEMPLTAVPKLDPTKPDWVQLYALNPKSNFSSATVTVTAVGSKLYKCKDWNFDARTCAGSWQAYMDIVPGQDYTITLDASDPGYGEIPITDAQHLDASYTFISNIYTQVRTQDNIWSERIPEDHYVRATFAQALHTGSPVNIIARAQSSTQSHLELYEAGTTNLVGQTGTLTTESVQYDVDISNLPNGNDIIDIKVVNSDSAPNRYVEFDYIHDARILLGPEVFLDRFNPITNLNLTGNWTTSNVSKAAPTAVWNISNGGVDGDGRATTARGAGCTISSGGCAMNLSRSINTTRAMNVTVNMTLQAAALDSGEFIRVFAKQSNGLWNMIFGFTSTGNNQNFANAIRLWNSSGNTNFMWNNFSLAFACGSSASAEFCKADNISVRILENFTPEVSGLMPPAGNSYNQLDNVPLSVNVSDNLKVDQVIANVTKPDSTQILVDLSPVGGSPGDASGAKNYTGTYSATSQVGTYTIRINANDTNNNVNDTKTVTFTVASTDSEFPNISYVNASGTFFDGQPVNISANVTDDLRLDRVFASIQVPNGTTLNITMFDKVTGEQWNLTDPPNNFSIQFNDTSQLGAYTVHVAANDTSNNLNDTITSVFTISYENPPSVNDTDPKPDSRFNASDFINITANISDADTMDRVLFNVSYPNGRSAVYNASTSALTQNGNYSILLNDTAWSGLYNITVIANDSYGRTNATVTTNFTLEDPAFLADLSLFTDCEACAAPRNASSNSTFLVRALLSDTDVEIDTIEDSIDPSPANDGNITFNWYNASNVQAIRNGTLTFWYQREGAAGVGDTVAHIFWYNVSPDTWTEVCTDTIVNIGAFERFECNVNSTLNTTNALNATVRITLNTVRSGGGGGTAKVWVDFARFDLNFSTVAPGGGADTVFPNVSYLLPTASSIYGHRSPVNISANITDDVALGLINASVLVPNGTKLSIIMFNSSDGTEWNKTNAPNNFSILFNDTSQLGTYTVRISANDTTNNVNDSITTTFDVTSVVSFTLLNSPVAFGSVTDGQTKDTTTDAPLPFVIQNDGNVNINISVNATTYFNSSATNKTSYSFKCGTSAGTPTESACNSPAPTTFQFMPLANVSVAADQQALALFDLPWQNVNDTLGVQFKIMVPKDEAGGDKSSTVTIVASETQP